MSKSLFILSTSVVLFVLVQFPTWGPGRRLPAPEATTASWVSTTPFGAAVVPSPQTSYCVL